VSLVKQNFYKHQSPLFLKSRKTQSFPIIDIIILKKWNYLLLREFKLILPTLLTMRQIHEKLLRLVWHHLVKLKGQQYQNVINLIKSSHQFPSLIGTNIKLHYASECWWLKINYTFLTMSLYILRINISSCKHCVNFWHL